MSRLEFIESQIAHVVETRERAVEVIADCNRQLLFLGSERNRQLGNLASRHLYAVPDLPPDTEIPDGAA